MNPSNSPYISFITTIKICKGYEFLIERINLYIVNVKHFCHKYDIPYEILICDNINEKNICKIRDHIIDWSNVHVFDMEQTYPNPMGFNMIESYGKNLCLRHAKGKFCCMTSADQLFSEEFFTSVKYDIQPNIFYRFATFEIPVIPIQLSELATDKIEPILKQCKEGNKRLCNPSMFPANKNVKISPIELGQKSGDVMLLDTESFRKIKGWPENKCFTHVDTAVCFVATNNYPFMIPPISVCTYTFEQSGRSSETRMVPNSNVSIDQLQWKICISYRSRMSSN